MCFIISDANLGTALKLNRDSRGWPAGRPRWH